MDGTSPITISMSDVEINLYRSGIRRGHCECLRQLAGQLREAAKKQRQYADSYKIKSDDNKSTGELVTPHAIADAYDGFANQLDSPASEADKEQQVLLNRYCKLRSEQRTHVRKLKDAIDAAICSWRRG